MQNLQKIRISYAHVVGSKKLEQFGFWRYDFTFTEHNNFFHMSYGLSEWLTNLSTTYCIRVRSCLKTKLWKKFSLICLKKYWRQSVMLSGKIPSTHSNQASPQWQHPENTHRAIEQDVTVHVNINFCMHLTYFDTQSIEKSIGKLAHCLYMVPSACWRHT